MKEKYFKPVAEVENFKSVDVITTSVYPDDDAPDTDIPWGS